MQLHRLQRLVGLRVFVLWAWMLSAAFGVASPAAAQSKSITWQRLDVDMAFQPNGDLRITETNVIQFTGGPFTFGFRDFRRVPYFEITDIEATENDANGKPLGLQMGLTNSGDFRVQYFFATPAQDETRTFKLTYIAKGAINYVDDGDEIYWTGVFAERNGVPVQQSRIRVTLPEALPALRVEVSGVKASTTGEKESIVIAEAQEPIPSGTEFKLRVVFPHGLAPTPAPTATREPTSPLASPLTAARTAVPTRDYVATVRAINAERPVTYKAADTRNNAGETLTLCLSIAVLVGLGIIGAINGNNSDGNDDSSGSSRRSSWTSSSSHSSSSSSSSSSGSGSHSSGSSGSSSSRGGGGGGFG